VPRKLRSGPGVELPCQIQLLRAMLDPAIQAVGGPQEQAEIIVVSLKRRAPIDLPRTWLLPCARSVRLGNPDLRSFRSHRHGIEQRQ
jgi:hypothetical protein